MHAISGSSPIPPILARHLVVSTQISITFLSQTVSSIISDSSPTYFLSPLKFQQTATKGQKAGSRHPNVAPSTVHDQSLAFKPPIGERAEQEACPVENPTQSTSATFSETMEQPSNSSHPKAAHYPHPFHSQDSNKQARH